MAEHQLTCAGCGAQFTYHRRKKYCTPKCRPGYGCTGARENAQPKPKYECWWCGSLFEPKRSDRTKACSRECGFKVKDFLRSARTTSLIVSVTVRRARCDECDKPFTSHRGAKVCSEACRSAYKKRWHFERNKAKHDIAPRECKECGEAFVPEYGSKLRVYCSTVCRRRHLGRIAGRKEKERLRDAWVEAVNPFEVFERDGWRCQHCKRKTPRKLRGSYDDRAPELDHIVPLAQGGEHSYLNTQCLCRACNAAKSDGVGGQLRLFG